MRVLALIPARGGSKRVPGKNIRPLAGKPLIAWSIEAAKDVSGVCDILVSTDDAAIAGVAEQYGALVPWLRPAALATDTAKSVDVALHALEWYEKEKGEVDGLLLLQPTSPFRRRETICRGIHLFQAERGRPIVGMTPAASHPMWCFKMEGNVMKPFIAGGGLHLRSQDLPLAYTVSGAFYLISPRDLRKFRSFFTETTVPLLMDDPSECIDIDTEVDWRQAEATLGIQK